MPLLARDKNGFLRKRMEECVDGEYQAFKSRDGAYVRREFFSKYPELLDMVSGMTDEEIWQLRRGGHDPIKVYAAYRRRVAHRGQPTVILAKTIKGYGMGASGQAMNITHQLKKMDDPDLKTFRDRFQIPVPDEELARTAVASLGRRQRRNPVPSKAACGAWAAACRSGAAARPPLEIPPLSAFDAVLKGSGERQISTTMAFVRVLSALVRDKKIGKRVVPIVPDESRTFGMEGMFRELGIFSQVGQLYKPEDSGQLMFYREHQKGQILQEGIDEAGRDVLLDRRCLLLQHAQRADDPVLYLLFDVRLSTRGRPGLGRGRHALPRFPARRHRRPHHAQRRRVCSMPTVTVT